MVSVANDASYDIVEVHVHARILAKEKLCSRQLSQSASVQFAEILDLDGDGIIYPMEAPDALYDEGDNPILVAKGDIDGDDHDDLISITQASSFRGTTTEVQLRQSDSAPSCPADFDGNGEVNVLDLLDLIGAWGPCT